MLIEHNCLDIKTTEKISLTCNKLQKSRHEHVLEILIEKQGNLDMKHNNGAFNLRYTSPWLLDCYDLIDITEPPLNSSMF